MSKKKKIIFSFLAVLVIIQFIRPAKNEANAASENDIIHTVQVPENVKNILVTSCYDCHSNHTNYLWYFNIQPLGLWLNHHINEGKEELNFSEFNTYKPKRQAHKLKEIAEQVKTLEMPISSYLLVHKEAKLSQEQIDIVFNWAMATKDSIKNIPAEVKSK